MHTFGYCATCRFREGPTAEGVFQCYRHPPTYIDGPGYGWPRVQEDVGCFEHQPRRQETQEAAVRLSIAQAAVIAAYTGHHHLCPPEDLVKYAMERLGVVFRPQQLLGMSARLRAAAAEDLKNLLPQPVEDKS